MKIYKYLLAFAATVALASCTQDFLDEQGRNPQTEGPRTIAVSFGPQTRTALDGLTPKFVDGDEIMVANGHDTKVCRVSVDGSGNASFTTDLTGTLKAVYPATAAKMSGNNIVGVLVPTVQDGTFASANICMAENITNVAIFQNKTAVLKIIPPYTEEQQALYVEVITARPRIANEVKPDDDDRLNKIHVNVKTEQTVSDEYYISILVPEVGDPDLPVPSTGLRVCDISFADGYNLKTVLNSTEAIEEGCLYTVSNEDWDTPYLEFALKDGHFEGANYFVIDNESSKCYKWATMNIGATDAEDAGFCFAWGDVTGHKYENDAWTNFPENNPDMSRYTGNWTPASGFAGCNAPYVLSTGSDAPCDCTYSKYNDTDGKTVLDLCDDAANANWGGSWRIPTAKEYVNLFGTVKGDKNFQRDDVNIISDTGLKFPVINAWGSGNPSTEGFAYWSANVDGSGLAIVGPYAFPDEASDVAMSYPRCLGLPVRAISD